MFRVGLGPSGGPSRPAGGGPERRWGLEVYRRDYRMAVGFLTRAT